MLRLNQISKTYKSGAQATTALRNVSIQFRPSEFVAVLGHSGSGKSTLLNIIGGLDRCTSGNMYIRGKDTRRFRNRDWDTYRNRSVGFVFQSYHLIPHQNVFKNVEIALTLCGVKRSERRRRTLEVLEKVGLKDQMRKRPNQLSGGQMQRVAIARALINDPEILLADEPTGSLDSETALQIMELLKDIAKDRLVIMVTHNPELAEQYATRTVILKDGSITSDSDPFEEEIPQPPVQKKRRRPYMSPLTSFSLSLSNLMTKKGRTLLTSFAGSIGIIGIAIILSLAAAVNNYVDMTEKNLLSDYPISITAYTSDLSALIPSVGATGTASDGGSHDITTSNVMNDIIGIVANGAVFNDLTAFKAHIESGNSGLEAYTTDIRYSYATNLNIFRANEYDDYVQVNPNETFASVRNVITKLAGEEMADQYDIFQQISSDPKLLENQYELLAGKIPTRWNELVLVLDPNGQVSDFTLYSPRMLDYEEVRNALKAISEGTQIYFDNSEVVFSYDDFIGKTFRILPDSEYYMEQEDGTWLDMSEEYDYVNEQVHNAEELTIVGVMKPLPNATEASTYGIIGYTSALMEHLISIINNSDAVLAQKATPTVDIFTGIPFETQDEETVYTMAELEAIIPTLDADTQTTCNDTITQMRMAGSSDEEIAATLSPMIPALTTTATYEGNLTALGVCDLDTPSSIELYPIDFESKEQIKACIAAYNEGKEKEDQIVYTDYVDLLMRSVTTIVDTVSYVIVAFVAISLVVSSLMIGIIVNISVLERTREIGILRAVGASKRDIARVFNAESMLIGLCAGLVGVGLTELLITAVNKVFSQFLNLEITVTLDPRTAAVLVAISMILTLLAGLSPARRAANRDPVIALRSE